MTTEASAYFLLRERILQRPGNNVCGNVVRALASYTLLNLTDIIK